MESNEQISLLWECVEHWARVKPDAVALVYGERRITWLALSHLVRQLANAFKAMGVQRGDCIAQVSMACPEFVISFMAAARVGAMWTGLSPKYSHEELQRILSDCQPALLLLASEHCGESMLDDAFLFQQEFPIMLPPVIIGGPASDGFSTFDEILSMGDEKPETDNPDGMDPDNEALLMYTSGSSGAPKGVIHTHRTLLSNVAQEAAGFEVSRNSRFLLHFPINHVAADVEFCLCSLYAGATIVLMDHFSAKGTMDTIEKEQVTIVGQVPAMYSLEFKSPEFSTERFRSVRTFIWGGSIASQGMLDTLAGICRETGAHMLTGYGATELAGFVTITRAGDPPLSGDAGYVYPDCEMRIVDTQRRPLACGETGEVAIRGPVLMKGYLNKPGLTEEVLDDDGWYYTSDLGRLASDGRLEILGRMSEMFKSGGENVFPAEVEAVLEAHPGVMFAAVIGVPDEVYDEVGFAFVVPVPGETPNLESVRQYCRQRLASFKTPRHLQICARLPLLSSGKVDKVSLRRAFEEGRMDY